MRARRLTTTILIALALLGSAAAAQQFGRGRSVAKSDLQLGDLVFFYSDIHHVGLYAGNGQVIHAPRPGKSVEYIKMSYMPYAGARRPG